ncbi:primosomal protein N' [Staphylococcus saprophyticus]|uniref:Replication restart protein PriA n=1 Tax=Staphylococcus saprophyticus subsp. saprophyticus (strain ATCC 15305 / DSM 20229 / NCIMB 8711 / NCTC 7292 / S-41) TaxID=342451 RepID=Q49WZ4_STAS1|nr:primosomal protein N' [Staphylococcus saprophyticus]AVM32956.1 primosomal protein N' [Staphylococcus saprophyticus]MCT1650997.1 primosomal protein N' [Staphylococcus saprophyticus]MDW3868050.1 primosomal protein N' [Staphylococcus saprophyticus]MDW3918038.1 primosomal protein N' [Staphylococcus saprophyticus]MDW4286158.1 primosomal protein N' [Staphylococcus saprophyticus]
MIAKVIVDIPSKSVDFTFDYIIPIRLQSMIQIGMRVIVPFGPRTIQGYVMKITDQPDSNIDIKKLKEIQEIQDIKPELTEELIQFTEWYNNYFVTKRISMLEVMLPSAIKAKYTKVFSIEDTNALPETLAGKFDSSGHYAFKAAQQNDDLTQIAPLLKQGIVSEVTLLSQNVNKKKQRAICVVEGFNYDSVLNSLEKSKKQYELYAFLLDEQHRIVLLKDIEAMGYSKSSVDTLIRKGFVEKYDAVVERDPFETRVFEQDVKQHLTSDQQRAFEAISEKIHAHEQCTYLLHGVTGSGKTEVYLQTIEEVLNLNRQAMMLVPEIALTPQMVLRFKRRFGDEVAVLHSGLSKGERYDEWQKIRDGKARVSVGARSSVFAPFKNLGMIIIDEEHESSYKQEDYPRYHARDIAQWRSEYHQCPLILGSATPSLESFARAEKGVYELLSLPNRVNQQALPEVEIVDMREELNSGNRSMFSNQLRDAIQQRLDNQEQIVLFLNRRGYASFMLCRDCGHVPQCPNCDISLTYHKSTDQLKCHYCGHQEVPPNQCPNCESEHIRQMGTGTQRVEELLQEAFQEARIIRMDVDTTSRKGAHEKLLNDFGSGKGDILLGTQMIAKGLDFPNITLVGVLNADTMLNLPDFRASERTYQLLTQVAGRAGRHEKEGQVLIQTYNPDHYAIKDVQENDYTAFFQKEMNYRKIGKYPPYFFLINFTIAHKEMKKVMEASKHIHKILLQHLTDKALVLGPSPAALSRINNEYRFQILVKYKREPALHEALKYLDDYYHDQYLKEKLSLKIDIAPQMMM